MVNVIEHKQIILVPFHEYETDAIDPAIQYVSKFSEGENLMVKGVNVAMNLQGEDFMYSHSEIMAPFYLSSEFEDIEAKITEHRNRVEKSFYMNIAKAGIENFTFSTVLGFPEHEIGEQGRLSDLIVLKQCTGSFYYQGILHGALFGSRKPVILIPRKNEYETTHDRVLIAWNGSVESSSALKAALPYLGQSKVWVLHEKENGKDNENLGGKDVIEYLKFHGISAEYIAGTKKPASVASSIIEVSKTLNVDLVVMGAWGHSRLGEYILGGVTDYMIRNSDVPLFLAH